MSLSLAGALTRLRGPVANGSNQPLTTSSEVWAVSRFSSPNVTVVNIDNGFGAAYVAAMIVRSAEKRPLPE
jgi:hypothetical protein